MTWTGLAEIELCYGDRLSFQREVSPRCDGSESPQHEESTVQTHLAVSCFARSPRRKRTSRRWRCPGSLTKWITWKRYNRGWSVVSRRRLFAACRHMHIEINLTAWKEIYLSVCKAAVDFMDGGMWMQSSRRDSSENGRTKYEQAQSGVESRCFHIRRSATMCCHGGFNGKCN